MMDHVNCCNCGQTSLVPLKSDICIKCGNDGALQWVDDDRPERQPEDFDSSASARLLDGDYTKEAERNALNG